MADFTVVAANVLAGSAANTQRGVAGVTITAGQALFIDTDFTLKLYDANGASPSNVMAGIALHGSLAGQPIIYNVSDAAFQPGFTVAAGDSVIGSGVIAGNLCPDADKASGWFVTHVGVGIGSNKIKLALVASGVAR